LQIACIFESGALETGCDRNKNDGITAKSTAQTMASGRIGFVRHGAENGCTKPDIASLDRIDGRGPSSSIELETPSLTCCMCPLRSGVMQRAGARRPHTPQSPELREAWGCVSAPLHAFLYFPCILQGAARSSASGRPAAMARAYSAAAPTSVGLGLFGCSGRMQKGLYRDSILQILIVLMGKAFCVDGASLRRARLYSIPARPIRCSVRSQ
jgi:hypothetical protein